MGNARSFFSIEDDRLVVDSIRQAEKHTSGEVRVHLEDHCKQDPVKRAIEVFEKLDMHKTAARNGVLFYLAVQDHKFAIVGDKGIDKMVPDDFWDHIKDDMQTAFRKGDFVGGLSRGILEAGKVLSDHFPYAGDDKDINELPDELSIGE